jgi:hypothetical protein
MQYLKILYIQVDGHLVINVMFINVDIYKLMGMSYIKLH